MVLIDVPRKRFERLVFTDMLCPEESISWGWVNVSSRKRKQKRRSIFGSWRSDFAYAPRNHSVLEYGLKLKPQVT